MMKSSGLFRDQWLCLQQLVMGLYNFYKFVHVSSRGFDGVDEVTK